MTRKSFERTGNKLWSAISGQRQRHAVDVAVHDEYFAALGNLHGVGLDPQLTVVKDLLHSVPALIFHHRLSPARCYSVVDDDARTYKSIFALQKA
ncbi:uncharacterized protein LOC100275761 [Zea mays]|uniref:Uncharacterized protein n=1 Tax=Zea mays TaxID=4577 RepID=B6SYV8_MAIZE|nr:uncharacterized protein LOC100275761 [Zea mays]ACG30041.1 hypothetical protein [Zea mays]|eukprot:NP_001143237.1 uncharacterized protein LOC100275761 [Zea mays]